MAGGQRSKDLVCLEVAVGEDEVWNRAAQRGQQTEKCRGRACEGRSSGQQQSEQVPRGGEWRGRCWKGAQESLEMARLFQEWLADNWPMMWKTGPVMQIKPGNLKKLCTSHWGLGTYNLWPQGQRKSKSSCLNCGHRRWTITEGDEKSRVEGGMDSSHVFYTKLNWIKWNVLMRK